MVGAFKLNLEIPIISANERAPIPLLEEKILHFEKGGPVMTRRKMIRSAGNVFKALGLLFAVAASLIYAGVGSALNAPTPDWGDPIPGHCAYEDPGFWVTADGGCKDVATGIVYSYWSVGNPYGYPDYMTHAEATDYCEGLVEGGFDDWILPSKDTLVEAAQNGAHGHLDFDTYTWWFMSSTAKKKTVWIVRLYNASATQVGIGSTMHVVCVRTPTTVDPPAAPSNLHVTNVTSSSIQLGWDDNSGNEQGFEIESSLDGAIWSWSDQVDPNETSYLHGGLTENTEYFYRVRAYNADGYSDYSNIASATTLINTGPVYHKANADIFIAGDVEGDYLDTWEANDDFEAFFEVVSGGKPSNRYSYLEHKWTINVGGGSNPTFWLKGSRSSPVYEDHFKFEYSTDDVEYIPFYPPCIITEGQSYEETRSFSFTTPVLNSTVYIRLIDSDREQGNKGIDAVRVDHMYITTE
jgi:hypothetical protein